MLSVSTDVMIRPWRHGKLSNLCAEKKLHGWQPCLACPGQRHHHPLAWPLLLLCEEIVDRRQVEFLVQGKQVHVQHKQIPPHAPQLDRKSTRLNSSHLGISYAVFFL